MKKICFLFYGSHSWGMGHVYRNIHIMSRLQSKYQVIALTNPNEQSVELLSKSELEFELVDKENNEQLMCLLKKLRPTVLVVDKLNNTIEEMKRIKKVCDIVIDLDDQGDGGEYSDILINAIVPLPQRIPQKTYHGTDYMIFHPEVEKYASLRKKINDNVSNILVCFGGSDPNDITKYVLPLICQFKDVIINVVLGPAYERTSEIIENYKNMSDVNVYYNLPSLSKLIFEADLCIISGGITLFECVFIGTPAIVISQVEHQLITASKYEKRNCILNAGLFEAMDIKKLEFEIEDCMKNKILREKLSKCCKNEIALNGLHNVVQLIEESILKGD